MPNINDRIGSQNVIRVLSNASAPPTRLVNLLDVNSTNKTKDGMILVWDYDAESFIMTDIIDSSISVITGLVTFTNTTQSHSATTGGLVLSGGLGVAKDTNIAGNLNVTGLSTFQNDLNIDGAVDILKSLVVNQNFKSVGVTTLSSSGGITTTGGDMYIGGDLFVKDDLVYDEVTGRNWNITGIGTIATLNATNTHIVGILTVGSSSIVLNSETDVINVGGGVTIGSAEGITTPSLDVSGRIDVEHLYASGISTFAGHLDNNTIKATGIATVGSLYVGTDEIVSSAKQLKNIASLDATTTATIEAAIVDGPNTFSGLQVTGLSTFVGLATFSSGIKVTSGISTFEGIVDINNDLQVAGLTTTQQLNVVGVSTFIGDILGQGNIDYPDGSVIKLGDNDELNVYHSAATASYIDNNASILYLRNNISDDLGYAIRVQAQLGEDSAVFTPHQGVDLYYDAVKKLETTQKGVGVAGSMTVDNSLSVSGLSTFVGIVTTTGNVFVGGTITATQVTGLIDGGTY